MLSVIYAECNLCLVPFILIVIFAEIVTNSSIFSTIILNVVILDFVVLSVEVPFKGPSLPVIKLQSGKKVRLIRMLRFLF